MSVPRFALLPTAVVALAVAAPASAVTGYRVSTALRGAHTILAAHTTAAKSRPRTCEKGRPKSKSSSNSHSVINTLGRGFEPVACEQPPKSEVMTPFTQASANAFASIG